MGQIAVRFPYNPMKFSDFTSDQIQKLKFKCQTDLYFLGKEILGKDFVPNTHKAMCEFYVVKNPKVRFKEFAQQFAGSHDRIQLVPRETYKSSIKVLDNVQWLINYPEIRILSTTATKDLASAFIDEFTAYFTVRGIGVERNPENGLVEGGSPTLFQQLFPEHCITETEATTGEFITPARRLLPANLIFKEPTAGTLSMEGTSSGWHCDILDFDDPVSDRNAETGNQLEKLNDRLAMIDELRMNYGFRHTVATRYHPLDPYGLLAESHGIKELYGDCENDDLKYMCRPCLWLKGQPYKQPDYKLGFPKEEDVELFFPEGSPYKALRKKFKNPKTFYSQQLNAPQDAAELPFTEDLIRSCIVDHTALPKTGISFVAWDHAWSTKNAADFSVGSVGLLDSQRRWWITDLVVGRFNFSEKCYQVVNVVRVHKPKRTCIEDSQGAQEAMRETLDRMAKENNVHLDIDWISLGRGTEDAKLIRMNTLHPWMSEKRMFFLNTIADIDELVKQFKNIGNRRAKNDIPDAIARMVEQYSSADTGKTSIAEDNARRWQELTENEFHNLIFRRGKYAPGTDWDNKWAQPEPEIERPDPYRDPMTGLPSPYPL